jgi:hypothetical protein
MPYGFVQSANTLDCGPRFLTSSVVVGSPALAAETLVAQVTGIDNQLSVSVGVFLSASLSFTVGTSGTAIRVRIRQGVTVGAGTVVADTGAITGGVAAANLLAQDVQNVDTSASGGAGVASTSYHVSLQVTAGSAVSTVSQANIIALVL